MAERMVYRLSCGCEVYRIMRSKPNLYRIQYCPKHLACDDMVEALGALSTEYQGTDDVEYGSPYHHQWQQAIKALAKAGGK